MNFKNSWSKWPKQQRQISLLNFLIAGQINPSENFLDLVMTRHHGVIASTDVKYSYAIFGRDSIEVAEDLLHSHPALVRDILLTLASLQGTKKNNISEEEPGKIHHEFRSRTFEGRRIPKQPLEIMRSLQLSWGSGSEDSVIYYGTYDASPLYIRLIGRYVALYGDAILSETYFDRVEQRRNMAHSLHAAIKWLVQKIEQSPWQLLEYKRLNPKGLANQTWKDSETSYLHLDGTRANYDTGIASVELQGYAYDALLVAAELDNNASDNERANYKRIAKNLQQKTLDEFWMPHDNFFAQGLDRAGNGETRQIKNLSSNAALLLETNLLKSLPPDSMSKYVQGVVNVICGPEFITPVGIRSRALQHKDLPGFPDYHGSYTVWPKETYDAAKGLRNFGLHHLAEQLENRILASVEWSGEFFEFFYVDENNEVAYDKQQVSQFLKSKTSPSSDIPQKGQAWVISAALSIIDSRSMKKSHDPSGAFETKLLKAMPEVRRILNVDELLKSKPGKILGYTRKTPRI